MDKTERDAVISQNRSRILQSYETYIQTLEELAVERGMDLDVMTDIIPGLLDRKSEAQSALSFLDMLYKNIGAGHRFIALSRVDMGVNPDAYDSAHQGRDVALSVHVRLFENLRPDQIKYIKGVNADSRVVIDAPHIHLEIHRGSAVTETIEESSDVLAQNLPRYSTTMRHVPELLMPAPAVLGGDTQTAAYNSVREYGLFSSSPEIAIELVQWAKNAKTAERDTTIQLAE